MAKRKKMSHEAWCELITEQGMPADVPHNELFQLEEPGHHELGQLGWTEAAFHPVFEEKFIEVQLG